MLINYLRKVLHFRTPEEDFAAGVLYVNQSVEKFGADNKAQMDRLFVESDSPFDRNEFDRGMVSRLRELNISHSME